MVPFTNAGSKVQNIEQVGIFNLARNLTNVDGLKIWKTASVIGAATGQVAKSEFTDGKNMALLHKYSKAKLSSSYPSLSDNLGMRAT